MAATAMGRCSMVAKWEKKKSAEEGPPLPVRGCGEGAQAIVARHGGYDAAEHGNHKNKSEIINFVTKRKRKINHLIKLMFSIK